MKKLFMIMILALMFTGCSNEAVENKTNQSQEAVANQVEETSETQEQVGSGERQTVFTDMAGVEVKIESKPQKVVCLYGSFADLWYEAGGDLVGIIESSTLPQQAMDLPKVGKMSTPNVEAILALEPDLVILREGYAKQEELVSIFEANNILVYRANYNSLEETMTTFKNFCGMNEAVALYTEKAQPIIDGIKALQEEKKAFTYLQLFASSKSISAKDDNITSEIINGLGGENIASNYAIADEESKQFSFEKIIELDPDYIFVQTMGDIEKCKERLEADVVSNPAWASLTAVKEGRFIYLPKELFLYKPNMKFLEAYEYVQGILDGQN